MSHKDCSDSGHTFIIDTTIDDYQAADGRTSIDVKLENETVWLTQAQMTVIFDCSSDNIGQHLKNIYKEKELTESSTTEIFSVVRKEGTRTISRKITHYNLDAEMNMVTAAPHRNGDTIPNDLSSQRRVSPSRHRVIGTRYEVTIIYQTTWRMILLH